MKRRVVSIRDIAQEVGLSPATVSLVLNHKAEALRISDAAQERVLEAAERLGYRPNLAARRLRSAQRETLFIALATAIQAPLSILSSAFAGAQLYARSSAVPIQITVEAFDRGKLGELPGLMDGLRYNGAVIANSAPEDDVFLATHEPAVPVVLFNRHVEGLSYIDATNLESGRMAARRLLQQGRRHLCVLYAETLTQSTLERKRGFCEVVEQAGLPALAVSGDSFSELGGYQGMTTLLASGKPCDGLFAVGDYMAAGAMRALREAGRRIPDDVAVVGHDNLDVASFTVPPLTTINLPLVEMAQEAVAALVKLIAGGESGPIQHTYPTELVVRQSG